MLKLFFRSVVGIFSAGIGVVLGVLARVFSHSGIEWPMSAIDIYVIASFTGLGFILGVLYSKTIIKLLRSFWRFDIEI
jgi:hypothetical protein